MTLSTQDIEHLQGLLDCAKDARRLLNGSVRLNKAALALRLGEAVWQCEPLIEQLIRSQNPPPISMIQPERRLGEIATFSGVEYELTKLDPNGQHEWTSVRFARALLHEGEK